MCGTYEFIGDPANYHGQYKVQGLDRKCIMQRFAEIFIKRRKLDCYRKSLAMTKEVLDANANAI